MNICKGDKFIRKYVPAVQLGYDSIYLGQVVVVTCVEGRKIHFKRKLLSGEWDVDCCLIVSEFIERFKPLKITLENK